MIKKCFKCKIDKDISDFYKHSQMKDGHLNKCKECTKADAKKTRNNDIEHYREYDRKRSHTTERIKARKFSGNGKIGLYCVIPKDHKAYSREASSNENWRKRNPRKSRAHGIVAYKLKTGEIHKRPCEVCGSEERIHAHHNDYSKPLEINWLCGKHHLKHHKQWHRDNGEAKNA